MTEMSAKEFRMNDERLRAINEYRYYRIAVLDAVMKYLQLPDIKNLRMMTRIILLGYKKNHPTNSVLPAIRQSYITLQK